MKAAIHQPNYLPYTAFFHKMMLSDVFVIFDNAKFSKGKDNFHARNKIRTENGWRYLTIPVPKEYNDSRINEVRLADNKFRQKHLNLLRNHYCKALYYKEYGKGFESLYKNRILSLSEFNIQIIKFLAKAFGINTKIVLSSELDIDLSKQKTDMVIEILKAVGADSYISGSGGRNYLDEEKFKEAGIGLEYQNFQPKPYNQVYPGFEPFMSSIDLLFNCGGKGMEAIL
jgi:hypothetical protein